jgi:hypothetical protein
MDYIGKYDNLPVYEANGQAIPKNTSNLYVTAQGTIYFGGVAIGKLDRRTLKVLSYDKDIYYKEMSRQKEAQRKEEAKKVPAPTCMAETAAIGVSGELSGADAFFAQIAKDIDETLKSAQKGEEWTFV